MKNTEIICRDCGKACGDNYRCFPDPEADPGDFIYIFLCEECAENSES